MLVLHVVFLFVGVALCSSSSSSLDEAVDLVDRDPAAAEALLLAMRPLALPGLLALAEARARQDRHLPAQETLREALPLLEAELSKAGTGEEEARARAALAGAWQALATSERAVGDAAACVKSAQESLLRDGGGREAKLLLAACALMKGDTELFGKVLCAPSQFALLAEPPKRDVYNLLLLGWASVTEQLAQAAEFAKKCVAECPDEESPAAMQQFEELRRHVEDPVAHPLPRLAANRKAIGPVRGKQVSNMLQSKCGMYLKKSKKEEL